MYDPSRPELDQEEREDRPEQEVVGLEEVTSPDRFGVGAEEGRPALAWRSWLANLAHVLLNRALGNSDPEFEQFTTNALGSPEYVVARYEFDQGNRLNCRLLSPLTTSASPAPEQAKTFAVPA
jgi:hypothetical protein